MAMTALDRALSQLPEEEIVLSPEQVPTEPTIKVDLVAAAHGNRRTRFEGRLVGELNGAPVAADSDIRVQVYAPEPLASSIAGTGASLTFQYDEHNPYRQNPAPSGMNNPEEFSRISLDHKVDVLVFDTPSDPDDEGYDEAWENVRAVVKYPLGYTKATRTKGLESITIEF